MFQKYPDASNGRVSFDGHTGLRAIEMSMAAVCRHGFKSLKTILRKPLGSLWKKGVGSGGRFLSSSRAKVFSVNRGCCITFGHPAPPLEATAMGEPQLSSGQICVFFWEVN